MNIRQMYVRSNFLMIAVGVLILLSAFPVAVDESIILEIKIVLLLLPTFLGSVSMLIGIWFFRHNLPVVVYALLTGIVAGALAIRLF